MHCSLRDIFVTGAVLEASEIMTHVNGHDVL